MDARQVLLSNQPVFVLVWGLILGDELAVVDGEIRSTKDWVRVDKTIPEDAVRVAENLGLIEFEDRADGSVRVLVTERGRHHVNAAGVRLMGRRRWEFNNREDRWATKRSLMQLEAAAAELFGSQPGRK